MGIEAMMPFGMPYEPSEQIATLNQSPAGVGVTRERTVSMAALAAEAAEEAPRALMMAAPRCCTVGMKVALSHSSCADDVGARAGR